MSDRYYLGHGTLIPDDFGPTNPPEYDHIEPPDDDATAQWEADLAATEPLDYGGAM